MKPNIFISGISTSALPSLKDMVHVRHGNLTSLEGCSTLIVVSQDAPDNFSCLALGYQANQNKRGNYVITNEKNYYAWRSLASNIGAFIMRADSKTQRDAYILNICGLVSNLEHKFYRKLLTVGIHHQVRTQLKVCGYSCDFVFEEDKLIVETDGHLYHSTKEARARDASKDRELQLKGWRVVRFTGEEIAKDIDACVRNVKEFLK